MRLTFIWPPLAELECFLATRQYEDIWRRDGVRIVRALQRHAGLRFRQQEIRVQIHDGVSMAGTDTEPVLLNVQNVSDNDKRAALMHELGHMLLRGHQILPSVEDTEQWLLETERYLHLFLWDAYEEAYGADFVQWYIDNVQLRAAQTSDHDRLTLLLTLAKLPRAERRRDLQRILAEHAGLPPARHSSRRENGVLE